MIRVLVADDSPSVRELLVYILGSDPEIDIVGCAEDGEEAVRMAQQKKPHVITMDLHMPKLDGFEATRKIMQTCPTPIVIVSGSVDPEEVGMSFRAIEAGALVMVQRPFGIGNAMHNQTSNALIRTVKSMAEVKVVRRWSRDPAVKNESVGTAIAEPRKRQCKLVLLGASTGGPAVLRDILAQLPADYPLPIVIVQHMASGFVDGFADWLSSASGIKVALATHGEHLVGGRAYLAPDRFQMAIGRSLQVELSSGRPEHGMRPSVSHLFRSIHKDLCRGTVAVLLTGMGKDGAQELRQLKDKGAITIVQDRATAAVYGMPGEAIKQDAASLILDPVEIGKLLHALGRELPSNSPYAGI
ncbi:chemotaxis-specific protein-glutamate methyltransferase CheB [Noviherbaspirillum sp.]|jgi:two-component system chemotaxis response regulator CheB|uniref:chemotaxis-specific protein-glutamate methyltransferase CheB n=1 Tax=Noviherbaspirillum sp. TaxID=1926288 RepID=UPI0025DD2782|nr:chemotaxis-specific protein-glutamate methyltransferase CheB [Noviherbaspirillum sp.]